MVARDRFGRFVSGDAPWKYGAHNVKHGHSRATRRSRTWISWHALNSRGTKGNYADVKVCWRYSGRNAKGFQNFLLDFGIRPRGKSIDRKNPSRGYYKSNMRWATPSEQAVNKILSLTAIAAKAWVSRRANGKK